MKKIFTLAAAVLASLAMSATTIFSYTLTAAGTDGTTYDAEGGTAKCVKAMASGGSNEITIGDQTFYKFNSSSAWEFTLADEGTFAEGDVISITAACGTSDKKGKGVKLNGIAVTGDFKASTANTLTYTVQAGDAIDGNTTIRVERIDSDIKFGTIAVDREAPSTDPVESAEINGKNACLVGGSIELTCSAPKATTFQWSMNGSEIAGATAKKYTFAPSAAGDYSFTCAASNEYNNAPVVSAAHVVSVIDPANIYGELITATLTSGSAATVTGLIGGTADVSLSSSKKMDKGKYFGITLASGNFHEGDTVVITMTTAGANYPCLFADKERTNCLFLATETSSDLEYKIVLPSTANTLNTLYLARDADDATYKWNPILSSMSVIRPETKTIVSTVETLIDAKINNVALDPNFLSELIDTKSVEVLNAYPTAPTVTFTKHVVITYDDESIKESNVDVEVVAEELGKDQWTAKFTLGDKTYSVTMQRATAYTVTYKLKDETVLGTEIVAAGTSPKEYAQYEVMPLAEFGGWYRESTLENAIDLANEVINADITVYAKFDKAYAQSINIEQWVLDNGKNNTAFKALLLERGYAYENINDLDSLNDDPSKANRNEPYLGLKIKKTGGYIAFNVLAGQSVAIKFGNADAAVKISVYGVDTTITPEAKALPDLKFTTEAETLVKIAATADKTVVIKQIMIDEPIADVVLPGKTQYVATCDSTVNGTISINGENSWKAYPGDTVVVTYQPAIGYQLDKITVDGKAITPEEGLYYFIMPAKNVTVSATFKEADPIVPPTRYAITIAEMQNGTVTADKEYASATELVTLTVTPAEGYKVADVKVNGVSLNPTNNTYSFEMPEEDVTITATFEPVQEATKYLVTIAELENGSIRFADLDNDDHKYYEGDLVHLIIIPAEGYKLVSANAGNEALQPDENGNCSFRMPGQDVTVSATFEPESQGIEDATITKKAVKVIRDGQVLIIRDGKMYNALGAEVK